MKPARRRRTLAEWEALKTTLPPVVKKARELWPAQKARLLAAAGLSEAEYDVAIYHDEAEEIIAGHCVEASEAESLRLPILARTQPVVTIAVVTEKVGGFRGLRSWVGVARCSPMDQFSRFAGRERALERAVWKVQKPKAGRP